MLLTHLEDNSKRGGYEIKDLQAFYKVGHCAPFSPTSALIFVSQESKIRFDKDEEFKVVYSSSRKKRHLSLLRHRRDPNWQS